MIKKPEARRGKKLPTPDFGLPAFTLSEQDYWFVRLFSFELKYEARVMKDLFV
jgi:hypothetical protein